MLLGRDNISQQDLWTRAWDGNPGLLSGRTHPMGILVEERGVAWNFPTGNEDIIYFIFTFYNVTARNCAVYAGLDPAIQAEICAVGQNFQSRNEAVFNFNIPDNGYSIDSLYSAFSMDPDVGDAGANYSTAILPFNMGVAYKADFLEPNWSFPPEIFGAPFVSSPGFVGVKYLRSPKVGGVEVGLSMFSNTRNAGTGFPDPVGVIQLYRYLSGKVSPSLGDNPCTVNPVVQKMCFLDQTASDTRFYESSGPFTLDPGQSQTIVVAYVHAAPTPAVLPFIGGDLKPGIPAPGDTIFGSPGRVRTIERAAGWVSQADSNGNSRIEQNEVTTVKRSLLDKALRAQAVFDNKFLLPFAPEPPKFFLVPGDNQVTIAWRPSETETQKTGGGDPFYAIASNPLNPDLTPNPLYDPNFKQYDVEGYRIYRGRTTGQLELVAQFDYAGTELIDFTGSFAYPTDEDGDGLSECAPELGIQDDCPITFPSVTGESHALAGSVIQIPAGGRVALANGSVLIVRADTAVTGNASGFPALSDGGVGFAFVDNGVRNSFAYHYAVTAFDVNSFTSGPSSLESPRVTKVVTQRKPSGQETAGALQAVELVGGDGSTLTGTMPTINATTGVFSGPMPPTDGINLGLAAFLPQVLADGSVTLTIDSIVPGLTADLFGPGVAGAYYVRAQGAGAPTAVTIPITVAVSTADASNSVSFPATAINTGKSQRFGGDSTFALYGSAGVTAPGIWRMTGWGRGQANGNPPNSDFNGPRWFLGATEAAADPNATHCPAALGSCGAGNLPTPLASSASRTAGLLINTPADTVRIFHVLAYNTVPNVPARNLEGVTAHLARAADVRVFWGAAGVVDSVVDLTHKVRVPFKTNVRASWGILNDSSFLSAGTTGTADGNNNLLTWSDIFCVPPIGSLTTNCGGAGQAAPPAFQNHARLAPIAMQTSSYAGTSGLAATGNGFIFYIDGEFFLMSMAALPASTQWTLRTYAGSVVGAPGAGYSYTPSIRPPAVPGLRARVAYQGSTFDPTTTTDAQLARIHTVPDPYYVTNALEITPTTKILRFVNLPSQAIVRIYSVSGVLVQVLTLNDATSGGELTWNLRNRNQQFVASGVYFYHVETPDGKSKVGRFTVVNFAQ